MRALAFESCLLLVEKLGFSEAIVLVVRVCLFWCWSIRARTRAVPVGLSGVGSQLIV